MSEGNALERRVRGRMAALESEGLLRSLQPPSGIDLCSNDYLGLSRHPLLAARLAEGAQAEGCGSTGSRLLRGERACFDDVESRFARFKGAERALYFGAGYLANLAVGKTIAEVSSMVRAQRAQRVAELDELTQKLVDAGLATLSEGTTQAPTVIVRGRSNLLNDTMESEELARMRRLFDELAPSKAKSSAREGSPAWAPSFCTLSAAATCAWRAARSSGAPSASIAARPAAPQITPR